MLRYLLENEIGGVCPLTRGASLLMKRAKPVVPAVPGEVFIRDGSLLPV